MKYYNKFLYFFGFFFWLSTAQAQVISWPNGSEVIEIGDKITIFEDPSTKLNIDQVRAESNKVNFKKSKNVNLSLGYTESVFWLRFTFNNTSGSPLLLSLSQAGLPIAHLFIHTMAALPK